MTKLQEVEIAIKAIDRVISKLEEKRDEYEKKELAEVNHQTKLIYHQEYITMNCAISTAMCVSMDIQLEALEYSK